MSTGEGWNEIMDDCINPLKNNRPLSILYFVTFVMIATFVMLNMFIMIILENFESADEDQHGLTEDMLQDFLDIWLEYDPRGEMYVSMQDAEELLRRLPPPMGIGEHGSFLETLQFFNEAGLVSWGGQVHFK